MLESCVFTTLINRNKGRHELGYTRGLTSTVLYQKCVSPGDTWVCYFTALHNSCLLFYGLELEICNEGADIRPLPAVKSIGDVQSEITSSKDWVCLQRYQAPEVFFHLSVDAFYFCITKSHQRCISRFNTQGFIFALQPCLLSC